ncbi:unnamed protein product [Rhizopus stolonifer]
MTPDMLMQPFEQSFAVLPNYYNNSFLMGQEYLMGYPLEDFRPTFYNPFEIKHRRRTSRAQLKVLEKSFSENAKPNATVRRMLAQQLDMTPRGVQIWFQNRRAKAKLLRRKQQQQQQNEPVQVPEEKKEWKEWMWSPEPFLEWSTSPNLINYSPQQMTPKLSPVGGYHDSCLDFTPSPSTML